MLLFAIHFLPARTATDVLRLLVSERFDSERALQRLNGWRRACCVCTGNHVDCSPRGPVGSREPSGEIICPGLSWCRDRGRHKNTSGPPFRHNRRAFLRVKNVQLQGCYMMNVGQQGRETAKIGAIPSVQGFCPCYSGRLLTRSSIAWSITRLVYQLTAYALRLCGARRHVWAIHGPVIWRGFFTPKLSSSGSL